MLSVFKKFLMLSVGMLNASMMIVVMLNAIMLSVIYVECLK
jgi:hypothetical protein